MTRLFGTDGIRARAYEPPLDEATVRSLGAALAEHLRPVAWPPRLLLAGDTRGSTPTLAGWLSGSFAARGGQVVWAGVLPTPAVSWLLREGGFAAGVVISASHNPSADNGIKVLAPSGEKLPESAELALEELAGAVRPGSGPALPVPSPALADRYLELLAASLPATRPLAGARVVVDAANGAASGLAEVLLDRLGARVSAIASCPDGDNINAACGATAPAALQRAVRAAGADAGLALDGDADRAILVDESGAVLDGDDILLAWARQLDAEGRLPGRRVVATVMSNFGLERALAARGIALHRCPVGDREVWQAMLGAGAALGGEQSGHVICAHHTVTGDGLLTGAHLLATCRASGRPASALSDLVRLPQVLLNVPVRARPPFDQLPDLGRELELAEGTLRGRGRVLLRYSGTEPLARVMVEGDDATEIRAVAGRLAEALRRELG